jgi:hypothetical protein
MRYIFSAPIGKICAKPGNLYGPAIRPPSFPGTFNPEDAVGLFPSVPDIGGTGAPCKTGEGKAVCFPMFRQTPFLPTEPRHI